MVQYSFLKLNLCLIVVLSLVFLPGIELSSGNKIQSINDNNTINNEGNSIPSKSFDVKEQFDRQNNNNHSAEASFRESDPISKVENSTIKIQSSVSPTPIFTRRTTPITSGTPIPFPSNYPQVETTFSPRVLMVGYNPEENGENAAEKYFNWVLHGKTAEEFEDETFQGIVNRFNRLSNNTINYQIVKKIHDRDFPTYSGPYQFDMESYSKCVSGRIGYDPGFCEIMKSDFNYLNWIGKNQICQIAAQFDIDEIWVMSLPYIMNWENFMIGPTSGFNVNGGIYQVPGCAKHYTVINATYERPDTIMHNFSHRVEGVMQYVTLNWSEEDKYNYWERFANIGLYSGNSSQNTFCGNGHFPGNTNQYYDYTNTSNISFNCADMKNFPEYTGETRIFNCTEWGCNDADWQEYWFSYLPRSEGAVAINMQTGPQRYFYRNWWYYILYPDNAIKFRK